MTEAIEMDLAGAYVIFALSAAVGALWMMQRTTAEAGFRGAMPVIKLGHRVLSAAASIVMLMAAADTLYYDTTPRVIDFAVQIVLISVLGFSAMRPMAATPAGPQGGEEGATG